METPNKPQTQSSENTKHDKCQKQNQTAPWHMISKLQKTKDKGKTPEVRGKKTPYLESYIQLLRKLASKTRVD